MNKNELYYYNNSLIRILEITDTSYFVIDCVKCNMPYFIKIEEFKDYNLCENNIFTALNILLNNNDDINEIKITDFSKENQNIAHKRFSMIFPILSYIMNKSDRSRLIHLMADSNNVSTQTIKQYLCKYLAYQDITILIAKPKIKEKILSVDEKNIRWALNKYFYTTKKNSLNTTYIYLLKEKYCNENGQLKENYPTFNQFRYFYRKHKKLQNYYISRNGLKDYQKNKRPLLGDNIQEFAKNIGVGMLDATICDIYLVNDEGNIIGRPILTACIDAYSSLCMGYSLTWEGGIYSLKNLMQNIITDKVDLCKNFNIDITKDIWDCDKLPGIFVTDKGSEYISENFEQISELGVTIINLPAYRPELKGAVEKFFDLIQNSFKPYLKGKGVIEVDFRERGAHDYRLDAKLTMIDFEKIILECIIYYNTKRILKNFPYTKEMLERGIQPFANQIWNYSLNTMGCNLIKASSEQVRLTLLPRIKGKFTRYGLIVNKLRYKNISYTEKYLKGEDVIVSYNPQDLSTVWIIEDCDFVPFTLIENQYENMNLDDVEQLRKKKQELIASVEEQNIQGKIDLAKSIENIADKNINIDVNLKAIRKNRKKEQNITHNQNL